MRERGEEGGEGEREVVKGSKEGRGGEEGGEGRGGGGESEVCVNRMVGK